jgi:Zn-dependent protease
MAAAGILINIILFVFNLIPIPPLDGGRVLAGLVPAKIADLLDKIEPYGFFIVLGLGFFLYSTGAFSAIINTVMGIFLGIFGLS